MCVTTACGVQCLGCWLLEVRCRTTGYAFGMRDVASNKSRELCISVEKKNQLDATEWFIALLICSTCFGHLYAHHQQLETICVCYYRLWCAVLWLLVVGSQVQDNRLCVRDEGCCEQHPSARTHSRQLCT